MKSEQLFSIAFGLHDPWRVTGLKFREVLVVEIELHLAIALKKAQSFLILQLICVR
jgi:hypothetical protein